MAPEEQHRSGYNFLGHAHRWRRFTPCILLLTLIAFVQFYAVTIKNPHIIRQTFETISRMRSPQPDDAPLHVLLVSYARTGSSFVGDLLQSLPGSFYHFEPLHFLSNQVLNDSFGEARALLDRLYRCNVTAIEGFLSWQKEHHRFMKFKRSINYWKECSKKNLCFNGSFIDNYCKKHQTVIAKTIRLKLPEAAELLTTHPHLNLKIIYLARDPRGAINSRSKFPVSQWCKRDPMCINPRFYCSALVDDLKVICRLTRDRPDDFFVLRYEDLSVNPMTTTASLTQFLGLPSVPKDTETFLKTHTSVIGDVREKYRTQGVDYPYSTFRNSSTTAMSWRQQMTFKSVLALQAKCNRALKGLGYYTYNTVTTMRSNMNFDISMKEALDSYCATI